MNAIRLRVVGSIGNPNRRRMEGPAVQRLCSSAVEHALDKGGAHGSIPCTTTIFLRADQGDQLAFQADAGEFDSRSPLQYQSLSICIDLIVRAVVAQLVERRTENPGVEGSIPSDGTTLALRPTHRRRCGEPGNRHAGRDDTAACDMQQDRNLPCTTRKEVIVNHKRGKAKGVRAGCLMCKPNKMAGWPKHHCLGHTGFGKIRREVAAQLELKES